MQYMHDQGTAHGDLKYVARLLAIHLPIFRRTSLFCSGLTLTHGTVVPHISCTDYLAYKLIIQLFAFLLGQRQTDKLSFRV